MKKEKVIVIIQARMCSKRLPGKVLKKVGGAPILEIIINRIKRSKYVDEVIVATTYNVEDDAIVDLCKKVGSEIYRGSENNVFSRYLQASKLFEGNVIVRVTGDNPLTDPEIMDQMIHDHLITGSDYTYPENVPVGLGCEIVSYNSFDSLGKEKLTRSEKEHVTLFIRNNPKKFKINNFKFKFDTPNKYRCTVDTQEDLSFIEQIYEEFQDLQNLKIEDLILFLENNPELLKINSSIKQQDPNESYN